MPGWSIFVDVEGFLQALIADGESGTVAYDRLGALMQGIYRLGVRYFVEHEERIFAYQLGDGFTIVDGSSNEPRKPIGIAVTLLRCVLRAGGAARAAISQGTIADVQGCYPEEIQVALRSSGRESVAYLGHGGLMTIFPIMGTAIIMLTALLTTERSQKAVSWFSTPPCRAPPSRLRCGWRREGHHHQLVDCVVPGTRCYAASDWSRSPSFVRDAGSDAPLPIQRRRADGLAGLDDEVSRRLNASEYAPYIMRTMASALPLAALLFEDP